MGLAGFILFNPLRNNFGACDKFMTGLALDLRKVLCESLLLRPGLNVAFYMHQI